MTDTTLKLLTRRQGNNAALLDGRVTPDGFSFEHIEVNPLPKGFRRMVRDLEFNVSEMALTTYLCAKEHGVKFTALPIFLVRAFHHGAIQYNTDAGIQSPKDLEGKRVGVNRGYTVTTGVWARAILADFYGVDLDKIEWVLTDDEHVTTWQRPPNVVPLHEGTTMEEEMTSGRIPAGIGFGLKNDNIAPLIPNAQEAGLQALRDSGHYPINHLVVVRDDVLEKHPNVAQAVYDAFKASRDSYLDQLKAGSLAEETSTDALHRKVAEIIGNPLPYGLEANRQVLENLMDQAAKQQILKQRPALEDVFAAVKE